MWGTHGKPPRARANGLLTEQVDDETVVYNLQSAEAHCLNPLAAIVFAHCDGRTWPAEIAALVRDRLGEPVSVEEISDALTQLQDRSLLEDPPLVVREGISRRHMIRKTAMTGAAATTAASLISTIAAPAPAAAATLQPPGGPCTQNTDCASHHCCQPGKECNPGMCVGCDNSCKKNAQGVCPGVCDPTSPDPECRCLV